MVLSVRKNAQKIKKDPPKQDEKMTSKQPLNAKKRPHIFTVIKRNVKICKTSRGCAKKTTLFVKKTKLFSA